MFIGRKTKYFALIEKVNKKIERQKARQKIVKINKFFFQRVFHNSENGS